MYVAHASRESMNQLQKMLLALCLFMSTYAGAQVFTSDSLALVDLYNSTKGTEWIRKDNWLTKAPVSTWYGITVTGNRVIKIQLSYNNLEGPLPASIGNISNLEFLYLPGNALNGDIPTQITNCLQLEYLYLSNNQLTGTIPVDLENCIYLIAIDLSNNQLSGGILNSFGLLGQLEMLNLGSNQLTGSIPASLGNCKHLFSLELGNNLLSGTIPESLGETEIQYLGLGNNQITGSVPISLTNLPYGILVLSNNLLNGPLPVPADTVFNYEDISGNKFNTFSGFDPGVTKYRDLYYDNQSGDSVPVYQTGNILSVHAGGNVANNTYKWFKDGFIDQTIVGDSNYAVIAPGKYYAVVTNALATEYKVISVKIDLRTLPVLFTAFTASLINNDALLKWQTAQEVNVSAYNVQRSIDGIHFTTIGSVSAKNGSQNMYSFTDKAVNLLTAKTIYYRIEEKDADGATAYSKVQTINLNTLLNNITLYPNPAHDFINIVLGNEASSAATKYSVRIFDEAGKVVKTETIIPGESNTVFINIASLAAGIYYAEVNADGIVTGLKFVKQ